MLKRIYILLALTSFTINAQIQNYNWNFGNNQSFSWKNSERKTLTGLYGIPNETLYDLPVYQIGSSMATLEGCFTISDYNGDLIMYSDGQKLWDKNNSEFTTPETLLSGNASSAQSGTIVPYPHSFDKFIVLTLGKENQNNLAFSVVEKNTAIPPAYVLNNTDRNIYLTGHRGLLGETVTAGRHSNKNDIWVLAVGRGNGLTQTNMSGHPYLNVWKLSDDSPTNNIINWTFNSVLDLGNQGVIGNTQPNGYIRFTNDSKHFVWANFGFGGNVANGGVPFICYGDFNNTTGTISNVRIKRGIEVAGSNGYGVEFTNDNKYLYVTLAPADMTNNRTSALLVYNFNALLAANTSTEIESVLPVKKIETPSSSVFSENAFFGAIQTGPDGRMYIASPGKKEVFVIDNPKDPVNLRMYKLTNPINGSGGTGTYDRYGSYWGLPNFAVPWYNTAIEIPQVPNSICVDKEIPFNLFVVDGHGFDKVVKMVVDYGDGSQTKEYTGADIVPGLKNESHIYKKTGEYKIKINSYDINNEIVNTTIKTIFINSCVLKANPYLRGEIE